jgi:hypothetical protein
MANLCALVKRGNSTPLLVELRSRIAFESGVEVPIPTCFSIIIVPSEARRDEKLLPIESPPFTESLLPGFGSPIPTFCAYVYLKNEHSKTIAVVKIRFFMLKILFSPIIIFVHKVVTAYF